ncbi:MAG: NADH-quinone oxidoreductase subunit NuoK [Acidimicrobiia bacterium]
MMINQFLLLGAAIFSLGVFGVLTRRNAVMVLLSVELMLAAININLIAFDRYVADTLSSGQVFSLFVITIGAAEVGIGLAIVLLVYRNRRSANVNELDLMKW